MNNSDEKLSLVLDKYSGDKICQSALDNIISDVNLQYQMRRYQMIGEIMRHELPASINPDLSHQVMSSVRAIDNTDLKPSDSSVAINKKLPVWLLKPFAGLAIAVSL